MEDGNGTTTEVFTAMVICLRWCGQTETRSGGNMVVGIGTATNQQWCCRTEWTAFWRHQVGTTKQCFGTVTGNSIVVEACPLLFG
jgi:hypothetical protein